MSDNTSEHQEFAAVLLGHAAGLAHDEASRLLRQAVEAVKETGKPASVTVKLEINPVKKNRTIVQIEDKVSAVLPRDPRSSIWFPDDAGALHRSDPNQEALWDNNKTSASGRDN